MARFSRVFLLLAFALFLVAACDAGGPQVPPTITPRPTSTTEAVKPHPKATATSEQGFIEDATPTPEEFLPQDTPTPEEFLPEDTPTPEEFFPEPTATLEEFFPQDTPTPEGSTNGADSDVTYTTYNSNTGGWSLEYPDDWSVTVNDPNTQFIDSAGQAFVQVTYSVVTETNTNQELAQIASAQFRNSFEGYEETGQEEQNDGSYRIDFNFTSSDVTWFSQAFVEQRGDGLYIFMLAQSENADNPDRYDAIFGHVIRSYSVPSQ